jgi:hypothetical protein
MAISRLDVADLMRVETLDLSLGAHDWAFARERRADIDAHFEELRQQKPSMWNGRVLLMHRFELVENALRGDCFETDFASFVAWRDFGFPDLSVKNVFALGALQGSDGRYVLGVMGAHTMNAGKIYFPAGTPDPSDLRGANVDLEASVRREVQEETGLTPAEFDIDSGWHCIPAGPFMALFKPMRAKETAAQLRERILDYINREEDPELAGAVVAHGASDIHPMMPGFIQTFLRSMDG